MLHLSDLSLKLGNFCLQRCTPLFKRGILLPGLKACFIGLIKLFSQIVVGFVLCSKLSLKLTASVLKFTQVSGTLEICLSDGVLTEHRLVGGLEE